MHSLTPVPKVWYNFLCVKIKSTLHLSTNTKNKMILLYAMTKGFQFDIRSVTEWELIESTQWRCTEALIHPSLIAQLCRLAEVSMLDSEEQVQQRLPIPLPKVKFGSPGNSDEDIDENTPAPSAGHLRTVTLRSPPVRLSPSQIRFMRSPHGLTHIEMTLRSTVLPRVRIWMPLELRWPPFAPARTLSRSCWLSSSLFTHRHCHYHRIDPL